MLSIFNINIHKLRWTRINAIEPLIIIRQDNFGDSTDLVYTTEFNLRFALSNKTHIQIVILTTDICICAFMCTGAAEVFSYKPWH